MPNFSLEIGQNGNYTFNNMRIGMILDGAYPPDPRVENEAVSLIQEGHAVFLYCLDYSGKLPLEEQINGIHITRIRAPLFLLKLSALAYTLPFYHLYLKRSIKAFIDEKEIEVLHVHDIQSARSVFSVNKLFRLPLVLDLHENRPEIMKYYSHVKSIVGRLLIYPSRWKKFEYRYIQQADSVIVVTGEARDHYLKEINVDKKKFNVVPNTVRKEFYRDYELDKEIAHKDQNSFTLLYLGETGLRRGIDTMIRSLRYLTSDIPGIKLLIVGKSKADQSYKGLIRELGLEKHVVLAGWKDASLFQSYITSSDVGACPIHRNIHHNTTFANKIFMYMSFGKPLIVSDCDAQANLTEEYDCGLVFKDRDAQDFADKVKTLYHDKELYTRCSNNGKEAIKNKLNWDEACYELIRIYKAYE